MARAALARTDVESPAVGSLGLRGVWALIANSSAVVLIAVALAVVSWAAWSMHNQDRGDLLRLMDRGFKQNDALQLVIERNTGALQSLAKEIHALRTGGLGPDQ